MGKRSTYLVFGQPHLEQAEIDEVVDTLRSGWLGTGPKTAEFERRFAAYSHAPHAVAVSSCTAALHLSLLAVGARPGTAVITTPFTFAATVNAIVHTGATPLLVDIDRDSMNLSPARLEEFLATRCEVDPASGRTRHRAGGEEVLAVVPVHFAGRPCAMDELGALAQRHSLAVVEDAAHAIEAWYRGRKVGSLGDFACFSFYATKNLTTGEGGMITTGSADGAQRLRTMASQGITRNAWARRTDDSSAGYQVVAPGYKCNLTDIASSIGLHQLARIDANLRRRDEIWARYDRGLADLALDRPAPTEADTVHARHLYTVRVDPVVAGMGRDVLAQHLHDDNIGTGIHFISIHLQQFFQRQYGYAPDDFPEARYVSERTLSLPLAAHLADEDIDDVIASVRRALKAG